MAITIRTWSMIVGLSMVTCLQASQQDQPPHVEDPSAARLADEESVRSFEPADLTNFGAEPANRLLGPSSQLLNHLENVCANPLFVSVAPIGSRGVTIRGTPGCTYTLRLSYGTYSQPDHFPIVVNTSGMGFLDVEIPSQTVLDLGRHAMHSISDSFETVPTRLDWALACFIFSLGLLGLCLSRRVSLGTATLKKLNRVRRTKPAA